ncbi:VOC family protein [Streptomyces albidoflavus]
MTTAGTSRMEITGSALTGAPCWATLLTHDIDAARDFYGQVLGWEFAPSPMGDDWSTATAEGIPVASLGAVAPSLPVAVDWLAYFAVADSDEAAGRVRERGGTVAIGPVDTPSGRATLAADPTGPTFGLWEGRMVDDWQHWRLHRPWWLVLESADPFAAALFYGAVLDWEYREGEDAVGYEDDEIVLRDHGHVAARLRPRDPQNPALHPRWNLIFPVPDVAGAAHRAVELGAVRLAETTPVADEGAVLRDPDGAVFSLAPASAGQ